MRKLAIAVCLMFAFSPLALAQNKTEPAKKSPTAAQNRQQSEKVSAQQEKMRACNKQASDKKLKGDERKKFMSACLKG